MLTTAIVVALALAVAFVLLRRPKARPQAAVTPALPLQRLSAPANACAEARALNDRLYPATQAPKLPLTGCAHGECTCRLIPTAERRQGERRIGKDRRGDIRFSDKPERRSGNDRRLHGTDWSQSI